MRYWAQFYNVGPDGAFVEAVGSDQIAYMDGRWSREHMYLEANDICKKRKFAGWRLARGTSLLSPFYLNAAVRVPD